VSQQRRILFIGLLAVAWLMVIGILLIAFLVAARSRSKKAESFAELMGPLFPDTESIPVGSTAYLWCDPAKNCNPESLRVITVYATEADYHGRFGYPCRRGKGMCVEPTTPLWKVPTGTAVIVMSDGRDCREVRVSMGALAGKTGFVGTDQIHAQPPRR
jgi:hypothetical protein